MADQPHDYHVLRNQRNEYATRGTLTSADGVLKLVTLGPPLIDRDNDGHRDAGLGDFQHGLYRCTLRLSHRHGGTGKRDYDVWQYQSVPDVDAAQLHIGNFPWDSEACTLVGTADGDAEYDGPTVLDPPYAPYRREHGKSYPGILSSGIAYGKFMKHSLDLCERAGRHDPYIWVLVEDSFPAPVGSFA